MFPTKRRAPDALFTGLLQIERQALSFDLNSQDFTRSQEVRVIQMDSLCGPFFSNLEWFKQSPVLEVMSVPRAVVNSVEASSVDLKRRELCQSAWFSLLENRDVEVLESEFQAIRCQGLAQTANPVGGVDVGIASLRRTRSQPTSVAPFCRNMFERNKVI